MSLLFVAGCDYPRRGVQSSGGETFVRLSFQDKSLVWLFFSPSVYV